MKISEHIGYLKSHATRGKFKDGLDPRNLRTLGGRFWKMLENRDKVTYLKLQGIIIQDDLEADYHIGDATFQNTLIGSLPKVLAKASLLYSKEFKEAEVSEFPQKIVNIIEKSTSAYNHGELLQATAKYQRYSDAENNRGRRYKKGLPNPIPAHDEAKQHSFMYYDQVWYGIQQLLQLEPEEQEERIIEGLVGNTNVGYPFFTKQTKDNFVKLWKRFVVDYLHFKTPEFLTVQSIFDVIKYCKVKKLNFPYVLFYRIQREKHRCVFGAHIVMKALGAVIHAAKEFGMTTKACKELGIPYNEDKYDAFGDTEINKAKIASVNKVPIIPQMSWDAVFNLIVSKLPDIKEGKLQPMSAKQIEFQFGMKMADGDYYVNVIGEDFPAFDTGIIVEDLAWLREHKNMGWIFDYALNDLEYSDVWIGDKRVGDVQFKSGHPFTSNFGSDFHRQVQYNVRDYIRRSTKEQCEIVATCNQSDDSISWWIGFDIKMMNKYLKYYGMSVKDEASYDYARDGYVGFLRVDCGYVLQDGLKTFVGNLISRYYKLCHSERPIEQDIDDPNKYDADVKGLFKVTGKIEPDALISKLSSFGSSGEAFVLSILDVIKETSLGREIIMIISGLESNRVYELYREDVLFGFNPAWLAGLKVLDLIVRKDEAII